MNKLRQTFDGITPPENLKGKVMAAVSTAEKAGAHASPVSSYMEFKAGKRRRLYRGLAIAASVVFFFSAFITLATVKYSVDPGNSSVHPFGTVAEVKNYVNAARDKAAKNQELMYRGSLFSSIFDFGMKNTAIDDKGTAVAPSAPDASGGGTANTGHSTTNNQVDGVAESDVALTDGNYIYALSYYGLTIAELDSFGVALQLTFDNFFPSEMFLLENERQLVILGSKYDASVYNYMYGYSAPYGVDACCCCYWYGNTQCVRVYDINKLLSIGTDSDGAPLDPSAADAAAARELDFPNCYLSASRMIGTKLYLVFNVYRTYVYDGQSTDVWIPQYSDTQTGGEYTELPPSDIYAAPENGVDFGYMLLAAADIGAGGAEVKAYFGSASTVYASLNAFYISYTKYSITRTVFYASGYKTYGLNIMRFAIDGASLTYAGMGTVRGFTLNQFGFDEYTYPGGKTYFRAATTYNNSTVVTGAGDGSTETVYKGNNRITIFDENMKQAALLDGLGQPGERIYSARFNGDTAVVVTYRNMDPLYVIDLSNPLKPAVKSELHIPGVSDYMQFLKLNPNLVFALGRMQNDAGSWVNGIKVSLFDTSTEGAATELQYYERAVGDGNASYTYSDATYDHKAILYFLPAGADAEIFGFPINAYNYTRVTTDDGWNYYYDYQSYCAFMYYTADAEGGLTQTAVMYQPSPIEIADQYSDYTYYYNDVIRRGIIADGCLYLVGNLNIEKYSLGSDFIPDASGKKTLQIGDLRF